MKIVVISDDARLGGGTRFETWLGRRIPSTEPRSAAQVQCFTPLSRTKLARS
jgi:hypothetical protein